MIKDSNGENRLLGFPTANLAKTWYRETGYFVNDFVPISMSDSLNHWLFQWHNISCYYVCVDWDIERKRWRER